MTNEKETVEEIRGRMKGRYAYVAVEDGPVWRICRCDFGSSGYTPTIMRYPHEKEAEEVAAELNAMIDLSQKEANIIIGDTMSFRPKGGSK